MTKLTVEEIADVMYRARLQYEGHDQETVNKMVTEAMTGPTLGQLVHGSYEDTLDTYFEEAEMILDWIEDNEPEARAIAGLLLRTVPDFKFNDGLILDALIERRELEPKAPSLVILNEVPPGFLDDLPQEDQDAIRAIVGQPVLLVGGESNRAMLQFTDDLGDEHVIWVHPKYVRAVDG